MSTDPTPTNNVPPTQTARQRYRAIMARRQMKVFGVTIAATATALAIALLGMVGILPFPFGNEFSRAVTYAEFGDTPCPTDGVYALPPGEAQLQVLNASSISGLAGSIASVLEEGGYAISLVDNAQSPFRGNVQIEVGPASVDQGYSIARLFGDPVRIRLKDLPPETITVILGEGFNTDLAPTADSIAATLATRTRLRALPECRPVDPAQASPASVTPTPQSGDSPESGAEEDSESESE